MNRNFLLLAAISTLATAFGGCSFLRDLSADQCKVDNDCAKFGNYECSIEKVCVARAVSSAGSGNGGSGNGGSGNTTAGKSGNVTGGEGGSPDTTDCKTNADCIDAHDGAPFICQRNSCVSLTTDQCPFVIAGPDAAPTEYLTRPGKPIIFGAYVPISVAMPENHPYTLNFRFALNEFMEGTLGGVGTPARPFVMVLCQSTNPDLKASVSHLVDTLEVPSILATLTSDKLKTVFDDVSTRERKVFLLGPLEADSALAGADDGGRMWHMLGPATDLIPTYGPLMTLVENYVRNYVQPDKPALDPLKVALVYSDLTYSKDMANALPSAVTVNGFALNAKENKNNYKPFEVKVDGVAEPDVSVVTSALTPLGSADIIISLGGHEFMDPIISAIQSTRTKAEQSPFYVLSPRHPFDLTLTSGSFFQPANMGFLPVLMAGVNYASVEDSSLYDQYLLNIQTAYPGQDGLESRENLYDAAYFMMYALAAANSTGDDFDGDDVVNGMKALVDPEGEPATVGPGKLGGNFSKVLNYLKMGSKVALTGTLGPPDFNPLTGARKSPGSVWCIKKPKDVFFDKLRLVEGPPASLKQAAGDQFCYENFFP